MAACSREMWLIAANLDLEILVTHKPGKEVILADALSRMCIDKDMQDKAMSIVREQGLIRTFSVPEDTLLTLCI